MDHPVTLEHRPIWLAILFAAVWSALRAIVLLPGRLVGTLLLPPATYRRAVELAA